MFEITKNELEWARPARAQPPRRRLAVRTLQVLELIQVLGSEKLPIAIL